MVLNHGMLGNKLADGMTALVKRMSFPATKQQVMEHIKSLPDDKYPPGQKDATVAMVNQKLSDGRTYDSSKAVVDDFLH